MVSWVGLQCMSVVFPDHTQLLSDFIFFLFSILELGLSRPILYA